MAISSIYHLCTMFRSRTLRTFSLSIVFLALMPSISGQRGMSEAAVSAMLIDENGSSIPFVYMSAHSSVDSMLIQGATTDMNGQVQLSLPPGTYLFQFSFLSYTTKWIGPKVIERAPLDLGRVNLEPAVENLQEVEIIGERSQMELKVDRRIYNVQQDLTNRGRNASDILDNIPSVAVNVEGGVSLRGSENVRILINGKPSGLIGLSGGDGLRQLQGEMIESIEVITNPSAKYEAEGEVGMINIILKKEKRSGINGAIDLNGGTPSTYGISGNMNWRKGDLNFFTSGGYRYYENPGYGIIDQRFNLVDTSYSFLNERDHVRGGDSYNFRFGSDWSPGKYWSFTLSSLVSFSAQDNVLSLSYKDFDENEVLTRSTIRDENEREDSENLEFDFLIDRTFEQKDRKWTLSVKWNQADDLEEARIAQRNFNEADPFLLQRTSNTENEENQIIQSDYVHPLGGGRKIEVGARSGRRIIDNAFSVEQFEDIWLTLPDFTNDLRYDEWITAGYGIYTQENERWSYQLGLRTEYSDILTDLKLTDQRNRRSYLDWFPSAFFSYEPSSTLTYQLNVTRRINRPRFRLLLPFYGFSDPRNFYGGNPDLNPEYSYNVEFNRLTRFDKGSVMLGIYSRFKEGIIQRIVEVRDTTTYTFPVNLGTGYALGAEVSANYSVNEIWRLNGNVNLFYSDETGEYEGRDYSFTTLAWDSRLNNQFKLDKAMDAQLSVSYRSPRRYAQGRDKSLAAVDLGMSRDVLGSKGTLTLSLRDAFNTRVRRRIVEEPGYFSENEFQWRSRVLTLNFSYRINQKKDRRERGFDMDENDFGG